MLNLLLFILTLVLLVLVPGLLLFRVIFPRRKLSIIESLSVFFTLGYSLLVMPSVLSYLLHLSWKVFYIMWLAEIIIIIYVFYKRNNPLANFFERPDRYDAVIIIFISVISVTMYLHGGHFVADLAAHLSYSMKLANIELIDPYSPMFRDAKEVPFSYAYCISYILFAFLKRLSGIELKFLWDLSPAVLSPFISSAIYFFSYRVFRKKEFVFLSLVFFYLYQFSVTWLDIKFIPTPDQFARNIFLYLGLGSFFADMSDKKDLYANAAFLGIIASLTTLTHMYSFFAFFAAGFLFYVTLNVVKNSGINKRQFLKAYAIAFLINFPFLFIKIFSSNYFQQGRFFNF